ncbi:hypothetical protein H696_04128 [Fonticula alba]|uniref:Glycosylphosphatidylinositol anchor biosynthesis protein 11 n=1 Tax=Fonticula alba TaxID=691883 RepID=A0A058Z860_FONAL|nr:hypothetical protein H696_04128 [Fonticula alba]KCV69722.1 hypothetical protein H696_04128 [Fonticula alba]|eukprot:XP_009496287.1 hypothetical protein H696_04128 [Fonticula alba]
MSNPAPPPAPPARKESAIAIVSLALMRAFMSGCICFCLLGSGTGSFGGVKHSVFLALPVAAATMLLTSVQTKIKLSKISAGAAFLAVSRAVVLVALLLDIVSILLGAPFVIGSPSTFVWSVFAASLASAPLVETSSPGLGFSEIVDFILGRNLNSIFKKAAWRIFAGTLLGAWVSVAVVPLDWERPWQAWPIPAVYGAVAGHLLGAVFALLMDRFASDADPTADPRLRLETLSPDQEAADGAVVASGDRAPAEAASVHRR